MVSNENKKDPLKQLVILFFIFFFIAILLIVKVNSVDDNEELENDLEDLQEDLEDAETFNKHFSEGYFSNNTNPLTITINAASTYNNITGFTTGHINGMLFEKNGVTVKRTGYYHFTGTISFSGGNQGEYDFTLFRNDEQINHCGASRTTSSTAIGNVGFSCLDYFDKDDHLTLVVEDLDAPAQDIDIYKLNLNIFELQ